MASNIHSTAIIEDGAELGDDVEIGAYAVIGSEVKLGKGSKVWHHATVYGNTVMGEGNEVFPYACLGTLTQDMKYNGGTVGVRIGDRNTFREYVTVNSGTNDGEFTTLGDDNLLLAYSHVGHNCHIGNHLIASNGMALAGDVTIEDHVTMGGYAGVEQFCRVGSFSFLGACVKLTKDVPPYMICDGQPTVVRSFNIIGMRRNGASERAIAAVKDIYNLLYKEGIPKQEAIAAIRAGEYIDTDQVKNFLEFTENSKKGFCPGARKR